MHKFSMAIVGNIGSGVIHSGEVLLKLWIHSGGTGFFKKLTGPPVAGGETAAAAVVTFADDQVCNPDTHCNLVFVLDWRQFIRLQDKLEISRHTIIFCDEIDLIPGKLLETSSYIHHVPVKNILKSIKASGTENLLALGLLARVSGMQLEQVKDEAMRHSGLRNAHDISQLEETVKASGNIILPAYLNGIVHSLLPSGSTSKRQEKRKATMQEAY